MNIIAYGNEYFPSLTREGNQLIEPYCGALTVGLDYPIYSKFVGAKKTETEIYLYEAIAILDDKNDQIYRDVERKKYIGPGNNSEIFTKYLDQLSQYKYTFKLEDGNYYFFSIERIK